MLYSAKSALSKALMVLSAISYTSIAYAEVIDKMPSLPFIWGVAFASGVVCLMAIYFRRWLIVLALFPMAWFLGLMLEIHSLDIRPALLAEAGGSYITQVYLAGLSVIALAAIGWVLNVKKPLPSPQNSK